MGRKKVFTTGQVAKICNVTTQTVTKWIDSERLEGYRIPGSKARRVTRENLIQFIVDHNIPTDFFADEKYKVLIVTKSAKVVKELSGFLSDDTRFVVQATGDPLSAGLLIATQKPEAVLIDTDEFNVNVKEAIGLFGATESLDAVSFVALSGMEGKKTDKQARRQVGAERRSEFVSLGYEAMILMPADVKAFLKVIHRLLGLN